MEVPRGESGCPLCFCLLCVIELPPDFLRGGLWSTPSQWPTTALLVWNVLEGAEEFACVGSWGVLVKEKKHGRLGTTDVTSSLNSLSQRVTLPKSSYVRKWAWNLKQKKDYDLYVPMGLLQGPHRELKHLQQRVLDVSSNVHWSNKMILSNILRELKWSSLNWIINPLCAIIQEIFVLIKIFVLNFQVNFFVTY